MKWVEPTTCVLADTGPLGGGKCDFPRELFGSEPKTQHTAPCPQILEQHEIEIERPVFGEQPWITGPVFPTLLQSQEIVPPVSSQ